MNKRLNKWNGVKVQEEALQNQTKKKMELT